jgi:hypothetical protein
MVLQTCAETEETCAETEETCAETEETCALKEETCAGLFWETPFRKNNIDKYQK